VGGDCGAPDAPSGESKATPPCASQRTPTTVGVGVQFAKPTFFSSRSTRSRKFEHFGPHVERLNVFAQELEGLGQSVKAVVHGRELVGNVRKAVADVVAELPKLFVECRKFALAHLGELVKSDGLCHCGSS